MTPRVWVVWVADFNEPSPTYTYIASVFDTPEEAEQAADLAEGQVATCHLGEHVVGVPDEVIVARVMYDGDYGKRWHFLGAFHPDDTALPLAAAREMYPGWSVFLEQRPVNRSTRRKR